MRAAVRALCFASLALAAAACHELGDVKVLSLSFDGTRAIDDERLLRVLATRQSGWLPWSTKRYFTRAEFDADLKRVVAFYADRGFPDARVLGVDVTFNQAKDGVRLRIRVEEGAPVVVEDVRFEGFDELPPGVRDDVASLPLRRGGRRDRDVVRATRDQAVALFRGHGFPLAVVDAGERPGEAPRSVIVTYRADAGPAMTFGAISVAGLEHVNESIVRRQLAFKSGEPYDERLVARSQRRLAGLEVLELAVITPRTDAPDGASVPVRVTLAEGKPRRLKLGVGYGSEEQARGTLSWQHLNFFGGAKQATVDGKYSAIDRGLRLGLTDPYVRRADLSLTVGANAWWTEQLTYDSATYGGRVTLEHQIERGGSRDRAPVRYRTRVTYANDFLRYGIKPEFLENQSRREERIALGLDPETGRATGTLASVGIDVERVALDQAANPRLGTVTAAHVEFAAPELAGTYRYTEVRGDVRGFVPVGPVVLGARVRAATLVARNPLSVPFSKRYFLGGSTSLRGWGRFQVSPLDPDGLPVGGHSVLEFSGEARLPLRGPVGLVLFADAGNVWREQWTAGLRDLEWAAGAGLRYLTPVGALRLDVARQLTRIDGLVVNGAPATRRWRVHFSIGHAF